MSGFGDFSRYSRIIPEEHQSALQASLKRIPDFLGCLRNHIRPKAGCKEIFLATVRLW